MSKLFIVILFKFFLEWRTSFYKLRLNIELRIFLVMINIELDLILNDRL